MGTPQSPSTAQAPLAPDQSAAATSTPDIPAPPPIPEPPTPQTPASQIQTAFPTLGILLANAREKFQTRKRKKLERIVALANARKTITNNDVEKLLRVSDATATRYLAQLVRTGRLRRVGHPARSHYEPAA